MAWPKDLNQVRIIGFPRSFLPKLVKALDDKKIAWTGECAYFSDYYSADFTWSGCRFRMEEIRETVVALSLIEWCND
jgi:hypothetical protein